MAHENILVVEDEEDILELIQFNLSKDGYNVTGVLTGEAALEAVKAHRPDLILLDLMLPGIDGLEVAKKVKADPETENIPIIMVTAKGEEADVVTGLEMGSDDYITKPFSPRILTARVKAVLRRMNAPAEKESEIIQNQDITIHLKKHEVTVNGEPVQLTFTEFGILLFLAKRPGWVFTRSQIVDAVKGDGYFVTDRAVDVQIVGLRKKLGTADHYIETVRGVGYRFKG